MEAEERATAKPSHSGNKLPSPAAGVSLAAAASTPRTRAGALPLRTGASLGGPTALPATQTRLEPSASGKWVGGERKWRKGECRKENGREETSAPARSGAPFWRKAHPRIGGKRVKATPRRRTYSHNGVSGGPVMWAPHAAFSWWSLEPPLRRQTSRNLRPVILRSTSAESVRCPAVAAAPNAGRPDTHTHTREGGVACSCRTLSFLASSATQPSPQS